MCNIINVNRKQFYKTIMRYIKTLIILNLTGLSSHLHIFLIKFWVHHVPKYLQIIHYLNLYHHLKYWGRNLNSSKKKRMLIKITRKPSQKN